MDTSEVDAILENYQQGAVATGTPLTAMQQAVLEDMLERVIEDIKAAPDRCSAEPLLVTLAAFQQQLAILCFRFQVTLPDRLRELVRVYDRSDVPDERDRIYTWIVEKT